MNDIVYFKAASYPPQPWHKAAMDASAVRKQFSCMLDKTHNNLRNSYWRMSPMIQIVSSRKHVHVGLIIASWADHLQQLISQGSQRVGLLRQMSKVLTSNVIPKLYLYSVLNMSRVTQFQSAAALLLRQQLCPSSTSKQVLREKCLPTEWTTKEFLKSVGWTSLRWRHSISSLILCHRLRLDPKPRASASLEQAL